MTRWLYYRDKVVQCLPPTTNWHRWWSIEDYKANGWSLSGLWSWRGQQCVKHLGFMPEPWQIELERDHAFFDPDVLCYCYTLNANQELQSIEIRHHGRKISRKHKLWKKKAIPQLINYAGNIEGLYGCEVNGLALGPMCCP